MITQKQLEDYRQRLMVEYKGSAFTYMEDKDIDGGELGEYAKLMCHELGYNSAQTFIQGFLLGMYVNEQIWQGN